MRAGAALVLSLIAFAPVASGVVASGFSRTTPTPVVAPGLVASGFSRTMPTPVVAPGLVASGFSRTTSTGGSDTARFEFQQAHMGTTARVVLYTDNAAKARDLADRAFARIAELDSRLSDYRA